LGFHVVVFQGRVGSPHAHRCDEVGAQRAVLHVDVHTVGANQDREHLHGAAGLDRSELLEERIVGIPFLDLTRAQLERRFSGGAHDATVLRQARVCKALAEGALRGGAGLDAEHCVRPPGPHNVSVAPRSFRVYGFKGLRV